MSYGGRKERDHEKLLTNFFICLAFLFIFYASSGDLFWSQDAQVQKFATISGMASSNISGHNDVYLVNAQLRRQLRNDVRVFTENELNGLEGGSLTTDFGNTNYEQFVLLSDIVGDETLGGQITVDYGDVDGVVGDYLFLEEATTLIPPEAFFEYYLDFTSGLKSNLNMGDLENLTGIDLDIIFKNYQIFSARMDSTSKNISLGLIAPSASDTLIDGESKIYYIDNGVSVFDYTVTAVEIPNIIPKYARVNVSSVAINSFESNLFEGDLQFLSDGIPIVVNTIALNESTNAGFTADGLANLSEFNQPNDIEFNTQGDMFIVDTENEAIRFRGYYSSQDEVYTLVSAGQLNKPRGITVSTGAAGRAYVTDTENNSIVRLDMQSSGGKWIVTGFVRIAGIQYTGGGSFQDGPGDQARFNKPRGITAVWNATNGTDILYVVDTDNHVIREIIYIGGTSSQNENEKWNVTTLAGDGGTPGFDDGVGASATFNFPMDIEVDVQGLLYITDRDNHAIRRLNLTDKNVITIVGNGTPGYVEGLGALFDSPEGISIDNLGWNLTSENIYVVDRGNNVIRRVTPGGFTSRHAGDGTSGYINGDADFARFNNPAGIAVKQYGAAHPGAVMVADAGNHRIRMIESVGPGYVVNTTAGIPSLPGNSFSFNLGGDFLEFIDTDYTDDENSADLGYSSGSFLLNGISVPEAFVQFIVNDTNLSEVGIMSMKYRLAANTLTSAGIIIDNQSILLSSLLVNPQALIGSFDILYYDLNTQSESQIKLNPILTHTYGLEFENLQNLLYNVSYITNEGSTFKYGNATADLVFMEGLIDNDTTTASAFNQDFTIGINDYFVVSNVGTENGVDNAAISHVLKYIGYDSANNELDFLELANGTTKEVTFTRWNTSLINGTIGFGDLVVGGNTYKIYIANLTNPSLIPPLAIDLNADGYLNYAELRITTEGGGVLDLGDHLSSSGGTWTVSSQDAGTWSETGSSISGGSESKFELISNYEEFSQSTDIQLMGETCNTVPGLSCDAVTLTENTASVTITNNLGYLANASLSLEDCSTMDLPTSLNNATTAVFSFEDCTNQDLVGSIVQKTFTLSYLGTGLIIVDLPGNLTSTIQGTTPTVCIYEQNDLKIRSVSGGTIQLSPSDITGDCGLELFQESSTNNYSGMTSYGAKLIVDATNAPNYVEVNYPSAQVKGRVLFVTDSGTGGGICIPDCSGKQCGDDGCGGSCGSCQSGEVCQGNQCQSCTPDCTGKVCGDDGCGGSCGSCQSNETCSNNQCIPCDPMNFTQACTDQNFDCGTTSNGCGGNIDCGTCALSNETCSNNLCVPIECSNDVDCDPGYICNGNGVCVPGGSGGGPTTFTFDLGDDPEEFDMEEYDVLEITGLSNDYLYVLERIYASGKIRFDLGNMNDHYYIDSPGDTENFDPDENDNIDFNIKSVDVDVGDGEVEILVSAGEFTSSGTGGGSSAYCGDGSCQSGESAFSCPADCGTGTTTPTASPPYTPPGVTPSPGAAPPGGTTVVTEEPTNLILWIVIGVLTIVILVIIVLTFMKPKSRTRGYSSAASPAKKRKSPEEGKYSW